MPLIRLVDGRTLEYFEFQPSGVVPVLFFHGTPGSGMLDIDDIGNELFGSDIRLISFSRPGYGHSSASSNVSYSQSANDIVQLLDALNIESVHLVAVSGGGPFAVAVAQYFSSRVSSLVLLSAATPICIGKHVKQGMSLNNKLANLLFSISPTLVEFILKRSLLQMKTNPEKYLKKLNNRTLNGYDRDRMTQLECTSFYKKYSSHLIHGCINGFEGYSFDLRHSLYATDLSYEDVHVRTAIIHGEKDSLTPISMANFGVTKIRPSSLHLVRGAGHYIWTEGYIVRQVKEFMCLINS